MSKYLVLYRLPAGAPDPMTNPDPKAFEAGKSAWGAWLAAVGPALSDFGSPTSPIDGPDPDGGRLSGFTILEAESDAALRELLATHPHATAGSFSVQRLVTPPGM